MWIEVATGSYILIECRNIATIIISIGCIRPGAMAPGRSQPYDGQGPVSMQRPHPTARKTPC